MTPQLRRSLVPTTLLALVVGVSVAAAPGGVIGNPTNTRVAGIDIDATTIPQLQQLMNSRRLSSVQLTQFYLRRIRQLNPALQAVITVSPTALADARAADAARRAGDRRPLLGIPIIVKDNINTTGMPTTAGSWALAGSTPSDAFIAARLKAAGAIIIGKANLSEWANFRSAPSSSGWSGIGGQTNMPYVLDRNPCGSSSGSGVVAAADLAVAAVGTETDGSIVCPSGANGVVGVKPTLGLWSRAGVGVSRKKVVPNSAATCSSTSTFIASTICCIRRMRRDMPSIASTLSRIGCSRGISESAPRIVGTKPGKRGLSPSAGSPGLPKLIERKSGLGSI